MLIKYYTTKPGQKPTDEQKKEIEEAMKMPIVYDEDCPELSHAMIKAMECVVKQRNKRNA